jgi:MOSC domain-containing protein YiiM
MVLVPAILVVLALGTALLLLLRRRSLAKRSGVLPRATVVGPLGLRVSDSGISSVIGGKLGHFSRDLVEPGTRQDKDGGQKATVTFDSSGIQGSRDWHRGTDAKKRTARVVEERAVCINSVAHYREMREWGWPASFWKIPIPKAPRTGENILVSDGFNVDTLCLGDVITCDEVPSLRLVVTHVRRPCMRFAVVFSKRTFLRIMHRGLAGIFLSVKSRGTLETAGATLRVVERPHPQWPLRRLNKLVYGRTGFDKLPRWQGTPAELEELLAIDELGMFQWKDFLQKIKA